MYKFDLNISIDDISPHPMSSTKVLEQCERVIQEFPESKFSLFIPIAHWRTIRPTVATKNPFIISNYPEFCDVLKNLPKENYEICYHGYYHGIPGENDNNEFLDLTYDQTVEKFKLMKQTVEDAGLSEVFKPIFRPPNWKMGPEAWDALHDQGIKIFAVNDDEKFIETYKGKQDQYRTNICTSAPPFKPLALKENTVFVYHASNWDKNYLNDSMANQLILFLRDNKHMINFTFMEGMNGNV
jgi:hypothetical protein